MLADLDQEGDLPAGDPERVHLPPELPRQLHQNGPQAARDLGGLERPGLYKFLKIVSHVNDYSSVRFLSDRAGYETRHETPALPPNRPSFRAASGE